MEGMRYDQVVLLESGRDGYDFEQCETHEGKTLTVGELIEILEGYDDDMPVFFSNDNGYTYGVITESRITGHECTEEDW